MANLKQMVLLIMCWVIACLGFGALLAGQQLNKKCEFVSTSVDMVMTQSDVLVDWQQLLARLTNQLFHSILHSWVC